MHDSFNRFPQTQVIGFLWAMVVRASRQIQYTTNRMYGIGLIITQHVGQLSLLYRSEFQMREAFFAISNSMASCPTKRSSSAILAYPGDLHLFFHPTTTLEPV